MQFTSKQNILFRSVFNIPANLFITLILFNFKVNKRVILISQALVSTSTTPDNFQLLTFKQLSTGKLRDSGIPGYPGFLGNFRGPGVEFLQALSKAARLVQPADASPLPRLHLRFQAAFERIWHTFSNFLNHSNPPYSITMALSKGSSSAKLSAKRRVWSSLRRI